MRNSILASNTRLCPREGVARRSSGQGMMTPSLPTYLLKSLGGAGLALLLALQLLDLRVELLLHVRHDLLLRLVIAERLQLVLLELQRLLVELLAVGARAVDQLALLRALNHAGRVQLVLV